MAKTKSKSQETITTEEVTETLNIEGATPETVNVKDAKAEPIKRTVIAKTSVPLRRTTSLEAKFIVGKMTAGVAYTIEKEVTSKVYGDFYQLSNGYYITKNGNYSIN